MHFEPYLLMSEVYETNRGHVINIYCFWGSGGAVGGVVVVVVQPCLHFSVHKRKTISSVVTSMYKFPTQKPWPGNFRALDPGNPRALRPVNPGWILGVWEP